MIDPLTAAFAGAALLTLRQLVAAGAEAMTLRARAGLVAATSRLPAGTEINVTAHDGANWLVRVPATPEVSTEEVAGAQ